MESSDLVWCDGLGGQAPPTQCLPSIRDRPSPPYHGLPENLSSSNIRPQYAIVAQTVLLNLGGLGVTVRPYSDHSFLQEIQDRPRDSRRIPWTVTSCPVPPPLILSVHQLSDR